MGNKKQVIEEATKEKEKKGDVSEKHKRGVYRCHSV